MRSLAFLVLFSVTLAAQEREVTLPAGTMFVRVRSIDSTRETPIRVTISGRIFQTLGFAKGDTGHLALHGNSGTATGTITGELAKAAGTMTFASSPLDAELELTVWPTSGARTPRLWARGHNVQIVRNERGQLRVRAGLLNVQHREN